MITTTTFANLTPDQQAAYQRAEAQDIIRRLAVGDPTVTQYEIDFAQRITGKTPASVTPGLIDSAAANTAANLEQLAGTFGIASWKALLPWLVLIVAVIIGLVIWKRSAA